MNKRTLGGWFKMIGITLGVVMGIIILITAVLNGSFEEKKYLNVWDTTYISGLETDQHKVIAGAIKAASSHNMQPWLIEEVSDTEIKLYADMTKDLTVIDPNHKQLLMSQGTFIEYYLISAMSLGYNVELSYGAMNFDEAMPHIASMKLIPQVEGTEEMDGITASSFNAGKGTMSMKQLEEMIGLYDSENMNLSLISTENEVGTLQSYLREATRIESFDKAATDELLDVFRFTESEKNKYRFGLTLSTMAPAVRFFIQPIMAYTPLNYETFAQQSVDMYEKRLEEEYAYIMIRHKAPSAVDFVEAGRIYQKIMFTAYGLNIRPNVQVLEEYDAMLTLNEAFFEDYGMNQEVMLVLGVRKAPEAQGNKTPRHMVEDILIELGED